LHFFRINPQNFTYTNYVNLLKKLSVVSVVTKFGIKGLTFITFLGLSLGIIARLWMRSIAFTKEFSLSGTLLILFVFTTLAFFQSLPFVIKTNKYLNVLKVFQVISIILLFGGAGSSMAPFIIMGGFVLWYPLSKNVKLIFSILSVLNILYVGYLSIYVELVSKYPSLFFDFVLRRAIFGLFGLFFVYSSVLWFIEGTFVNFSNTKTLEKSKNPD
jgi:hypothetical protein